MSEILSNTTYEIYLFTKGNHNSLVRKIVSTVKNKSNSFNYNEIVRKIDQQIVSNNNNIINHSKNDLNTANDVIIEESKQCKINLIVDIAEEPQFEHTHTIRKNKI